MTLVLSSLTVRAYWAFSRHFEVAADPPAVRSEERKAERKVLHVHVDSWLGLGLVRIFRVKVSVRF